MSQPQPSPSLFQQIVDPANRADPYPLYAQLRETPVSFQEGGGYVVSTYAEIAALLVDPRLSSDEQYLRQISGLAASGEMTRAIPASSCSIPRDTTPCDIWRPSILDRPTRRTGSKRCARAFVRSSTSTSMR